VIDSRRCCIFGSFYNVIQLDKGTFCITDIHRFQIKRLIAVCPVNLCNYLVLFSIDKEISQTAITVIKLQSGSNICYRNTQIPGTVAVSGYPQFGLGKLKIHIRSLENRAF